MIRGARIDLLIVHRPSLNKIKFSLVLGKMSLRGGGSCGGQAREGGGGGTPFDPPTKYSPVAYFVY